MGTDAFIDYDRLESFRQEVANACGWLLIECRAPVGNAMASSLTAVRWPDEVAGQFGFFLDQRIASIAESVASYVSGLREAAAAYGLTDESLARK